MEDQEVNLRDPRGLQQGDPLSLLLFTSVAHGLDRMVDDVVQNGVFRGSRLGEQKLSVFYFLLKNDRDNLLNMVRVLEVLDLTLDLKMNMEQSFFVGN